MCYKEAIGLCARPPPTDGGVFKNMELKTWVQATTY